MKEATHIIQVHRRHQPTLKSAPKKPKKNKWYELTKKNGNQSSWTKENIWTYQTISFSCPVSPPLLQGVMILNGVLCYAISAVKHQRKWIIKNMILWSGGVQDSYLPPAVASLAVRWSVGSLNLSHGWVRDAATPLPRYGPLPPRRPFSSPLHLYLPWSTLTEHPKNQPQYDIAESKKKKKTKKKARGEEKATYM